ncbi:MAG: hypothetical protein KAS72_05645 [Phycisphaerales bacterium]|nr:hypothetical protein [Phycisphaerales bacterium]
MSSQRDAIAVWEELLAPACAPLRDEVAACDEITASAIQRWRTRWSTDVVHAAIELAAARVKAARKFPDRPDVVADVSGIEQATSQLIAEHKAERFAALRPARIVDLCCGIGGDAMSLAHIGPTLAVDMSPLRAWMAGRNAGCPTEAADVEAMDLEGGALRESAFHIDPARRDESAGGAVKRHHRFDDYRPGPAFLDRLLHACPTGAIKLGPGVDFDALPKPARCELELISEHGALVQAVLWTGELARQPGMRTATCLPLRAVFTGCVEPIPVGEVRRYVFTLDPAVERADLVGALARRLGIEAVHPKLGLLTADEALQHPLLTRFTVHCDMPWREKKVKAWLHAHDAGIIEVKTRGGEVDPDAVQHRLRGGGSHTYTVFILRWDRAHRAMICSRAAR